MENNYILSINNKKIFEFYAMHTQLDFENINLIIIECLEKCTNVSVDNIMAGQLLQNVANMDKKINKLTNSIQNDIANLLTINTSEKIGPMVKEYMNAFQDRTKIILQQAIPENNEKISNSLTLTEYRINEKFNEIKTITTSNNQEQNYLSKNLKNLLEKMGTAPGKGKISENSLESILNGLFPNAEITSVAKNKESADFLMCRNGLHDIRFENKNFWGNIPTKEVNKFKRDMEFNNSSGIMPTQNFGISSKDNFEIEICNSNVYVYLHNVQYDSDKIKSAVSIIDHLKKELEDKEVVKTISMDKELFAKINSEYIKIMEQRENIINEMKKANDKTISKIREMGLPSLCDFIALQNGSTETKKFICEYCGKTPPKNNFRGLETHQRTCKEKNKSNLNI